uniref:Uncharacterized protein n=1 Tax=Plectus sambesii TaxID=2011161 RepID=A0A914V817_9BILA
MSHTLSEVKTLVIAGGIFFLLCAVVGLAKAGIPSKTLISCSPLFWLVGIIICGLFLRLCDAVKGTSRRVRFPERVWNSQLAASELGVFICPQTVSVGPSTTSIYSLSQNHSVLRPMTRKSSLPRYDELMLSLPPLPNGVDITVTGDELNSENVDDTINGYDHSEPPSYNEAMALCRLHDSKL